MEFSRKNLKFYYHIKTLKLCNTKNKKNLVNSLIFSFPGVFNPRRKKDTSRKSLLEKS